MSETVRTQERGGGRVGSVLSGIAVGLGCLLFLGGFVWGALVYQPYTVPTDSMAPTVEVGDRVLAQRIDGSQVRRGDVVVFREALWGDMPMLKRVVGVGGDKVACCAADGRLTVNGKPVDEPYLRSKDATVGQDFSVTVPEGKLFLLGDERRNSMDSRVHLQEAGQGSVPRSAVTGRVDAIAWPMDGVLARPTGFAGLPGGISEPGPVRRIVTAVVAGAALVLAGAAYGPLARMAGRRRGDGARGEKETVAA
ncbi:signal peptidase I [Streptomyces sp. HUAS MG47]|uniref:signal peptidase I n=1 Tax=Streptomyces solicamelliae TaxID=3231716 RepID=UPI00387837E4